MKGDFSRDTFDSLHHFSRVLMQQGRVQLDADWNEQVSVLLHHLRALAKDMNGPFWGPGFEIVHSTNNNQPDLEIKPGNYYVNGILCENEEFGKDGQPRVTSYFAQPDFNPDKPLPIPSASNAYLVYLDVWERHLTYLETTVAPYTLSTPNIREVALGGADTTTRSRVMWQVKVQVVESDNELKDLLALKVSDWTPTVKYQYAKSYFSQKITDWKLQKDRGMLKAMAKQDSAPNKEPCLAPPEASYRGLENQLYRVEIHRGGLAWNVDNKDSQSDAATFKWSRDNGSIIFPVRQLVGQTMTLERFGHDNSSTLAADDWVEIVDDDMARRNQPGLLAKVSDIDRDMMTVTLKVEIPDDRSLPAYDVKQAGEQHALLRRWDHKNNATTMPDKQDLPASGGALLVSEGKDVWITLENGVQISFQPAPASLPSAHTYRTGDYWLIPARVATQDVEWPKDAGEPKALPPHGIHHHYAPLAIVVGATDVKAPWRTDTA